MKREELEALALRLNDYSFISKARRVEDNTIEIRFDKRESYFFNMTRGHSFVYKRASQRPLQGYNAPFDRLLHTLLSGSRIQSVTVPQNDRLLRFTIEPKSAYKNKTVFLQLEFTGRHTNAILLDENETIIEALRHIDEEQSFRIVRPGIKLQPLPSRGGRREEKESNNIAPEDIDPLLESKYLQIHKERFEIVKKQKLSQVAKKILKLEKEIAKLPSSKRLMEEAARNTHYGNLILANLHKIEPYDTTLSVVDFDEISVTISLPKEVRSNRLGEYYFNLAKRAKNRAEKVYIERENLESKKRFYENIYNAITEAKDLHTLELLVPKRGKSQRKRERVREGELYRIEDYKVLVGRNAKENQSLLEAAKSNDIWMHVREIPGSHVIIRTDKQNVPDSVLEAAAKLCVDFSTQNPGNYLVDYTKRKFVKIQEGANVEYDKYQTISVLKEGIEIRL